MQVENYKFKVTNLTLLNNPWNNDYTYGAVLVRNTYVYSSSHSTYASISPHVVGSPITVQNKQKRSFNRNQFTVFDSDNLDFTSQGSLQARGVVIFAMPNNSAQPTSPLAFFYRFNETISITEPLNISNDYGLYSIKKWDFLSNLVLTESFESEPVNQTWSGLTDTQIVQDVDYLGEISKMIRIAYIPTSVGSRRINKIIKLPAPINHALLRYRVFFETGFEFVLGGKMHGLIPTNFVDGGREVKPEEWSSRISWGESGKIRSYNYHQNLSGTYGEGQLSAANVLKVGQWQLIEHEVKLNSTPGSNDGYTRTSVDGVLQSNNESLEFYDSPLATSKITSFMFNTFYGGSAPEWAPSTTTYAKFDDFNVFNLGSL